MAEPSRYADLRRLATESLEANVVSLASGSYLVAGAHQFRSLWTRDFAHAIPGLLAAGRSDVVRDHLDLLLAHAHPDDGLLPRTFDTYDAKLRVAWASVSRLIPFARGILPVKDRLRPEYRDQHGQLAVDGNALVVIGAARYRDATGDQAWWDQHLDVLRRVHGFYTPHLSGGLVHQPPFSDWQDSVRREGASFYTNLLTWKAAELLGEDHQASQLRESLETTFLGEGGLYRSLSEGDWISLEGNLLAVDLGYVTSERARELQASLRASPFWTRHELPGFDTYPDYPRSWRGPAVIFAGLGHYHDRILWSWLTALSARVAIRVGDLDGAQIALDALQTWVRRDGVVSEIYQDRSPHLPWTSLTYRSEAPFSWGAAMILAALETLGALES
ncbi:MAG: hypothetical protein JKY65_28665 [Planctomycetes bacterium]|nr:hypothetical protein [Planctomycetota bacterium]